MTPLRIATRGSALALWQAEHVATLLRAAEPGLDVELQVVETTGDRRRDVPISEIGGKGVFAKEIQAAVLEGRADVAVHSAKDLPSATPAGLVIASTPQRGDVRDALVGSTLDGLPEGATVGTGSLRRRSQLGHLRPDLKFAEVRGNMHTRIAKADELDAVVVAATALDRLGLAEHIAERLSIDVMLPQVAQGALAAECRVDDGELRGLLERIEHGPTRSVVEAERAFLVALGGDCSVPAAAHATTAGATLRIRGLVAAPDGSAVLRHEVSGPTTSGPALGRSLARHLLDAMGGAALLGRA